MRKKLKRSLKFLKRKQKMAEETSRLFKQRAYLIIRWFWLWFYATQLKCTLRNLHLVLYT